MSSFSHRSLDFVIPGDELEQHRIRLENNLQHYDPSFSPTSSDRYFSDSHSIEQPRRNSAQSSNRFASLEHPSYDQFDPADPHRPPAWSYRSGEDEDGINPYGGETVSTAAHHASALTFSAGLGRRGGRRDMSVSGAEFDPDRPLQEMIANYRERFSFLEGSKSKSKSLNATNAEPVVVDDTAEMDRILQAGHSMARENLSARLRRPSPPSSVTSDSESPARPKLVEALERVSFSPRRPRTVPARPAGRPSEVPAPPKTQAPVRKPPPTVHDTPRAQPRRLPSAMATPQAKLRSQPTPPSSKFTKMARGINQDLEVERTMRQATGRTPDSVNRKRTVNFDLSRQVAQDPSYLMRSKLHLPDFTGLTSAVESPARVRLQHRAYQGRANKAEEDLLPSLDALHKKLLSLEMENGVSRRRVRELEMELRAAQEAKPGPSNHKASIKAGKAAQVGARGDEVAEEQQALEELVMTLRGHLTRLTEELSSQRQLLMELREQRDADQAHDRDKSFEIGRLKSEVERLAGEVEVLRGVVEEGLRETRAASLKRSKSSEDQEQQEPKQDADWSFSQAPNANENKPRQVPVVRIASPLPRLSAEDVLARSASFSRASTPPTAHSPLPQQMSPSPQRTSSPTHIDDDTPESLAEDEGADDTPEQHGATLSYAPDPEPRPVAPTPAQTKRTARQSSRMSRRRSESPENAFPKIRGHRMEQLFFSAPEHDSNKCTTCKRRYHPKEPQVNGVPPWLFQRPLEPHKMTEDDEGFVDGETSPTQKRSQVTLARVLRELEDDFSHYKSIYVEMADQYKYLDAMSDIPRRKALAKHLHEIIELLEQRGDQIASLYELLKVEEKHEA